MTHLLDTSAFLAFFFGEPGSARVEDLLSSRDTVVGVSVITPVEFWSCLKADGNADAFESEWRAYSELFVMQEITAEIASRCVMLREASPRRLPTIDALIAATAASHGATLVHRDPHFGAVPTELLHQEALAAD